MEIASVSKSSSSIGSAKVLLGWFLFNQEIERAFLSICISGSLREFLPEIQMHKTWGEWGDFPLLLALQKYV